MPRSDVRRLLRTEYVVQIGRVVERIEIAAQCYGIDVFFIVAECEVIENPVQIAVLALHRARGAEIDWVRRCHFCARRQQETDGWSSHSDFTRGLNKSTTRRLRIFLRTCLYCCPNVYGHRFILPKERKFPGAR